MNEELSDAFDFAEIKIGSVKPFSERKIFSILPHAHRSSKKRVHKNKIHIFFLNQLQFISQALTIYHFLSIFSFGSFFCFR